MSSITELGSQFPGNRSEKQIIKLNLKRGTATIYYEDGTELVMDDPVQVQDFLVTKDKVKPWFKALRAADTTLTRYSYQERSYLQDVLNQVKGGRLCR